MIYKFKVLNNCDQTYQVWVGLNGFGITRGRYRTRGTKYSKGEVLYSDDKELEKTLNCFTDDIPKLSLQLEASFLPKMKKLRAKIGFETFEANFIVLPKDGDRYFIKGKNEIYKGSYTQSENIFMIKGTERVIEPSKAYNPEIEMLEFKKYKKTKYNISGTYCFYACYLKGDKNSFDKEIEKCKTILEKKKVVNEWKKSFKYKEINY